MDTWEAQKKQLREAGKAAPTTIPKTANQISWISIQPSRRLHLPP